MEFTLKPSETPSGPPPTMTCPKCGFEQPEGGKDCVKCGIVFARYKPPAEQPVAPPPQPPSKEQEAIERMKALNIPPPQPGLFSRLFRVLRWAIVLGCLAALVMMLRKAPPPPVAVDPEAPQKIEAKMQAVRQALEQGQPSTLQLNEAELNNWLHANLALSGTAPQAGAGGPLTQEQVQSSMKDVKIHLVGDQVHAYTLFTMYGRDVTLQLTGKLQVKDGRIRLDATDGLLGTLPIPKATLGTAVATLFDAPTNREKFMLPPNIADIRVENSQLMVIYKGAAPQ
jgi:hypothetical protein